MSAITDPIRTENEIYYSTLKANQKTESGASMDMNDFLKLLAAQMSNQDMANPMSNAEFIGQLAQFTSLQSMQELMGLNMTSYSVGLMGQEVTVARSSDSGDLFTKTGVVSGVGLFEGDPVIYIGDDAYALSEIMAVGRLPGEQEPDANENADGD
jgi:flagellar basal-body rod modification protein FlgD